jgi:xylulokinase
MQEVPNLLKNNLIGIDLGSSGVKATLIDETGKILSTSSANVDLYSYSPGWAEADTNQWWNGVIETVNKVITNANINKESVKAVSVSGMVPAVVVIDENFNPLRNAMLQNDARATKEIEELNKKLANVDLLKLTGSKLTQQSVAPSILWLKNNESEIFKKIKYVVGSYDWLSIKLGAQPHVEQNWAIESGLYNWDETALTQVLEATNIDFPQLLPVKKPGSVIGNLNSESANQLGLTSQTQIVVGGADHVLSAYAAGLINQGDCLVKLGGAGDVLAVSDEKFLDERLYLDAHPSPNKWLPNGCMATSGSLLRWEQSIFDGIDLALLDQEAEKAKPGNLLTLPYFLGEKSPLHDPDLRGVIAGLHLGTTRADIHRSFLEAIAFGFKQHIEIFNERGLKIINIKVTNGGSKSKLWKQILADVLDQPLSPVVDHPGASLGAALLAGIGTGIFQDFDIATKILKTEKEIIPNALNKETYANRYQDYLNLNQNTVQISHSIARGK